jgi:murein DD-endopeptidase MepM/ murein hydrolase activator NlpD
MRARRYTVVIADRHSGVVRRVTVSLRPVVAVVALVLLCPVLIGLGAKWSAQADLERTRMANAILEQENGSYRAATGALTDQIRSLEGVIDELGARAALDPAEARAIQNLPKMIKSRAAGGSPSAAAPATILPATLTSPEDTFGALRELLGLLESRLLNVRRDVERREALVAATPSIWPTHNFWLSGGFGVRRDPFSGEREFHSGLDLSTDRDQPVYATADGHVEAASYSGDYGNLIVLRHAFSLSTRYGHLSRFAVRVGDRVRRGQVIGFVGATGRATGSHLHYEILANGQLLNPLQLLTQPASR